jgi:hypothetical protein
VSTAVDIGFWLSLPDSLRQHLVFRAPDGNRPLTFQLVAFSVCNIFMLLHINEPAQCDICRNNLSSPVLYHWSVLFFYSVVAASIFCAHFLRSYIVDIFMGASFKFSNFNIYVFGHCSLLNF